MKKGLALVVMSMVLCITSVCSMNVNASNDSAYAWPGRPGGNGDGSEEWLQGEYGETNGSWNHCGTKKGTVADLNKEQSVSTSIGEFIVSCISGYYMKDASVVVATLSGSAISSVFTKNYEGQEYVMNSYISGRCMKNVIITYWDKEHTDHCKTYTNYIKW